MKQQYTLAIAGTMVVASFSANVAHAIDRDFVIGAITGFIIGEILDGEKHQVKRDDDPQARTSRHVDRRIYRDERRAERHRKHHDSLWGHRDRGYYKSRQREHGRYDRRGESYSRLYFESFNIDRQGQRRR